MIRMGRGSRTDQTNDTGYQSQTPEPAQNLSHQYSGDNPSTTKPVTDSESMARDIKEGRLSGFVGHGTTLTGETTFQAMLRVDGHLVGSISSETGTLIVGTNGQVDANISVAVANVSGTINGDIIASEKIHLGRTAKVIGNIQAPRLTIEDGAVLEGGCTMLKAREEVAKQNAAAQKQAQAIETSSYTSADMELDADEEEEDEDQILARMIEEEETEDEEKSESVSV